MLGGQDYIARDITLNVLKTLIESPAIWIIPFNFAAADTKGAQGQVCITKV